MLEAGGQPSRSWETTQARCGFINRSLRLHAKEDHDTGSGRCGTHERPGFHPWVGRISCRRRWQPAPVFSPGESRGQRGLAGCGSQGRKESDTTEVTQRAQTADPYPDGERHRSVARTSPCKDQVVSSTM